jgi:hypothetical protein
MKSTPRSLFCRSTWTSEWLSQRFADAKLLFYCRACPLWNLLACGVCVWLSFQEVRIGALLGLGVAYAGSARDDVKDLFTPFIVDTSPTADMEVVALAGLALGMVFVGTSVAVFPLPWWSRRVWLLCWLLQVLPTVTPLL